MRHPTVYILASKPQGTLYTGVTSNLIGRHYQHATQTDPRSFTARYGVKQLVWFEQHDTMESAIKREKQVKGWRRSRKIALIEEQNPYWTDLWPQIAGPY